ncbi:P-loop containing nucleoside triphosphate hydrolase protein [Penicillium waksmanii]|uniref:P-loop containing nucleoside triphosphate hydrolase protein n=1 Tax=Penicillium waksmanii TaxID=69791 RepID=UPI002547FC28|nr:P-loop containing nucleoside triphosphate hydrolase protein [Penicillium waksmanii]KAJ5984071.1 P-loop containing nucleoside triphosphate hydrolase protein [Penicillium waksmanii]
METMEPDNSSGDGNRQEHLEGPEDAQAAYIRKLEDRLAALENKMLSIESARPEKNGSMKEDQAYLSEDDDSVKDDKSSLKSGHDGSKSGGDSDVNKEDAKAEHPPFPPTVAEVRSMDFIQASHHVFTAPTIPAIELSCFPKKKDEEETRLIAFRKTFKDVSPKEALDIINANYLKPHEMDMNLQFEEINILSVPLSQLLWSTYYDENLPPDQMASFGKPWISCIYRHEDVKNRLAEMEKEQEQPPNSEVEPLDQYCKNSKLLDEFRAYVRLMEDTILPYYAGFKTKTAADNLKVYYYDLWHLFEPGEIIYYPEAKDAPSKSDYAKLHRSKRPDQKLWRVYTRLRKRDEYWVKAYCIDYDGESYVCVKEWFNIEKFEGKRSVNSFKVFPVRFSNSAKDLLADATESGRAFMKNRDSRLMGHEGWTSISDQDSGTSLIYTSGDVMIDFAETFRVHPDWKPISMVPATYYPGGWGSELEDDNRTRWYWTEGQELKWHHPEIVSLGDNQMARRTKREYVLEKDNFLSWSLKKSPSKWTPREEDLCLLPSRLFGYSFQDRRFVAMDSKNLRQVEDNRNKFKNLIIDQTHEGMLLALVESHFRRKDINETAGISTNQDIVQNKGRGLVILLHGVPGVGKTSTAEMIASTFQRPLLPITCGDLGLDPATVEKSLKQMFRVGQLWDCILLLDEADVFLSERVSSDLNRNALVSVFLRVLDYYSGILFLTTNRVGTTDEAFKSRIHISLYYPYLDLDQTEKIWAVNLERLAVIEAEQSALQPPLSIDREDILKFAKRQYEKSNFGKGRWNGRQIRNAFLIASALAHYEKTHGHKKDDNQHDLNARHFRTVVKAGSGFERYLLQAKGMTDQEAAYRDGTRADHVLSAEGAAPRTPVPTSAQPAQPPVPSAPWASQYTSHTPFTPPRNASTYNLAHHSPGNSLYPQQHQNQHQHQHFVYDPQDTFGHPPMATGYPIQRALTPGSSQPQPQPHAHGWNTNHSTEYDSDI